MIRLFFIWVTLIGLNSFSAPINTIIGDQGYERITGLNAIDGVNEKLRVQCHLLYVEYLLRKRSIKHLSLEQKMRRRYLLNQLHTYAIKDVFPQNNYFTSERKPCFIDDANRICAVGHLVASSEGWDAAEKINNEFQYNEVYEMNNDVIAEWAEKNGLTLEECAMIQPSYEWVPNRQRTLMLAVGSSYRFENEFYSFLTLQYSFRRIFKANFNSTVGVKYTPLKDNNYSLALFYDKSLQIRGRLRATTGIGVENYQVQSRSGFNVVPEVALAYQYIKGKMVFDTKLAYGYHFNVSKNDYYLIGRNDLSLQVGLGFRL